MEHSRVADVNMHIVSEAAPNRQTFLVHKCCACICVADLSEALMCPASGSQKPRSHELPASAVAAWKHLEASSADVYADRFRSPLARNPLQATRQRYI